jgi:hypothetical protein
VKPVLVAEVKFSEWTKDYILRQPIFMGLREDKHAKEVHKENAVNTDTAVKEGENETRSTKKQTSKKMPTKTVKKKTAQRGTSARTSHSDGLNAKTKYILYRIKRSAFWIYFYLTKNTSKYFDVSIYICTGN